MKKLFALTAALSIACMGLGSCAVNLGDPPADESQTIEELKEQEQADNGEGSIGKDGTVHSETAKGDDGNAMPAADKIYKPKSDHAFLDILEDIKNDQEVTIVGSIIGTNITDMVCYAYSEPQGKFLNYEGVVYGTYKSFETNRTQFVATNGLYERTSEGEFVGKLVNLDAMTKTGKPVRNWNKDTGEQTIFQNPGYDAEDIPSIPHNLDPDRWSFSGSGTKALNGVEYYSETYNVKVGLQEKNSYDPAIVEERDMTVSVLFDAGGNVAFMGAENFTPQDGDNYYEYVTYDAEWNVKSKTDTALSMLFYDEDNGYDLYTVPLFTFTAYENYVPISISADFNSSWDLDNFTMIDSFDEYMRTQNQEKMDAIRAELGL